MKYLFALLFFLPIYSSAQHAVRDTTSAIERVEKILHSNAAYHFYMPPVSLVIETRERHTSDGLFYYVLGLLLYIALIRLIFYKYFSTLFTLFFRATLRQQQLREQLLQSPLPALLLNIFFVVVTGTYITLAGQYLHFWFAATFWQSLLYAMLLIALIYAGKFIVLNIAGWIFGIGQVAETYIFIVFLINKMTGIFLLPFVILLAFPNPEMLPVVLSLSYILLSGMLIYRFIISYRPLRSEIKLNRLHFFLYLCAFEIAPLLLIYKVLLAHVDSSL